MAKKKQSLFDRVVSNDILVRATKTFLQAFLAVLAVGIVGVSDVDGLKALAVAGFAAGFSAVQNLLKQTYTEQ